jgi:hypothetical protein
MTFVEVIVSIGLVAGMATVVLGGVGLMENAARRDRHRLEAMEVAHRVILQMVDDPRWLDNQVPRVEHGGSYYTFQVQRAIMIDEEDALGEGVDRSRLSTLSLEDASMNQIVASQVLQVTVWVYLERPDGSVPERPMARLTRVYNPVMGAGNRGIEWMMRLLEQDMGG